VQACRKAFPCVPFAGSLPLKAMRMSATAFPVAVIVPGILPGFRTSSSFSFGVSFLPRIKMGFLIGGRGMRLLGPLSPGRAFGSGSGVLAASSNRSL
jgi:hypothetical protein